MNLLTTKKFFKYLLIFFFISCVLMTISFIDHYTDDVFGKGLPFSVVMELLLYTFISVSGISLIVGIHLATIAVFRHFSANNKVFSFNKNMLKSTAVIIPVAVLFFFFNDRVQIKNTLEMRSLLYDIRNVRPFEELVRTDKEIFREHYSMIPVKSINIRIDSLEIKIAENRLLCDSILRTMPDSLAAETYSSLALSKFNIQFNSLKADTISERDALRARHRLISYGHSLRATSEELGKLKKDKTSRYMSSVVLLFLFLLGSAYGYLYNDQKLFLLIILGIFTTTYFYKLLLLFGTSDSGNVAIGNIVYFLIYLSILLVFLVLAMHKEKKISRSKY